MIMKKLHDLKRTIIMGILNITPDSFSDGGSLISENDIEKRVSEMISDGADIIDIGGQSTRPGYCEVSLEDEIARIKPALEICKKYDTIISIDTYFPAVAEYSLKSGAHIINDVRGIDNPDMLPVIKKYGCGYVIMHDKKGSPEKIANRLESAAKAAESFGISHDNIILDGGIGFGKDNTENLVLINNYDKISQLGYITLVGASRKRIIGASCNTPNPRERVFGTVAAHVIAINRGANIIRVHDILAAKQSAMTADAILR